MERKIARRRAARNAAGERIRELLDELHVDYNDIGDQLRGPCPIHNGDNLTAFSWDDERKQFKCWTHHCHEKHGSGPLDLVMAIRDCSLDNACDFVFAFIKDNKQKSKPDYDINRNFIAAFKNDKNKKKELPILTGGTDLKYLVDRGFPLAQLKHHEVFSCTTGKLRNRIVFPITNLAGQITAYTGRTIFNNVDSQGTPQWKNLGIPKWKHLGSTGNSLYGAYKAQEYIERYQISLICEGPLDVLKLRQAGVRVAVACFGNVVTDKQMEVLTEMGAIKVFIGMDMDEAGQGGMERSYKKMCEMFDITKVELSSETDWGDREVKQIQEVCKLYGVPYEKL